MLIAVDFDGTISNINTYPEVGTINEKAIEVLKILQEKGNKIILWTCRNGETLDKALNACKEYGLEFDYVNESPYETGSRKIVADIYIDDACLGGIVDWNKIEKIFEKVIK